LQGETLSLQARLVEYGGQQGFEQRPLVARSGRSHGYAALGADWQIHAYGNTLHAFTNPVANDRQRGTLYDAAANRRSWIAMNNFLEEILI